MSWDKTKNIAKLPNGIERSILGYAGESLVIGRALVCGFNLFFKAWRDSKYDAVLDSNGSLFRIEIKQSGDGTSLSCTSGGRSGQQINRSVASRQQVLSTEDSEFLVGVHSLSAICWIVPTEYIEIRNQQSIPTNQLEIFKEKWLIFTFSNFGLSIEDIKTGFKSRQVSELQSIASKMGIVVPSITDYQFGQRTLRKLNQRDWLVVAIWESIFKSLP